MKPEISLKQLKIRLHYRDALGAEYVLSGAYDTVDPVGARLCCKKLWQLPDGGEVLQTDSIKVSSRRLTVSGKWWTETCQKSGAVSVMYEYGTGHALCEVRLFMPSAWYGDNELITDRGCKFPYENGIAGGPIDGISAPIAAAYCPGGMLSVEAGKHTMRTIKEDAFDADVIIDKRLGVPSVGVYGGDSLSLFYQFPGWTYGLGRAVRRYLPLKNGSVVRTSFSVGFIAAGSFNDGFKKLFRKAYRKYAVLNSGIDTGYAREVLLKRVADSQDVVCGVPQYMTDCDHFVPESGFLYRNADLAYLMLCECLRTGDLKNATFAEAVIDAQVKGKLTGDRQAFPFNRSRAEGAEAILSAYNLCRSYGKDKSEWKEYAYSEAEWLNINGGVESVALLLQTGHTESAAGKAENVLKKYNKLHFFDGIVDFGGGAISIDRESGLKGMEAMLALYEHTKEKKWLYGARLCGDYLETYQNLQLFPFLSEGMDGTEHYNVAGVGNADFPVNGLSFISAGCLAGDAYIAVAAPLYYKLSLYSHDAHYADFARYIQHNTLFSMDLGNKAGKMSDYMFSRQGFINEYYQLSRSTDPVGPMRGCAHDSDIAWCPYVLLSAQEEVYGLTGSFFLHTESCAEMRQNVAKSAKIEFHGGVVGDAGALADGDFHTAVLFSAGAGLTMRYEKPVAAENITLTMLDAGLCKPFTVYVSANGTDFSCVRKERGKVRVFDMPINASVRAVRIDFPQGGYVREIQLFAKHRTGATERSTSRELSLASMYSPIENSNIRYLARGVGGEVEMRYDNLFNEWRTDCERHLLFKSANLVHPGKEHDAVIRYVPELSEEKKVIVYLRPFVFSTTAGADVSLCASLNGKPFIIASAKRDGKSGALEQAAISLKRGDELEFSFSTKGNCNDNCLTEYEIILV